MNVFRAAFAALLLAVTFTASAGVGVRSVTLIPSPDGDLYSDFPNGDKPIGPGDTCDVPSGWACDSVGAGSGSIAQESATEWDFDVFGLNNTTSYRYAYKDGGGADVELGCLLTDTYAGSSNTLAAAGCGIRETTGSGSWQLTMHSLQAGSSAVRCTYGDSTNGFTNVQGPAGQARPIYVSVDYDISAREVVGLVSTTGTPPYTEVCRVPRALSNDLAFVYGNSQSDTESFQFTVSDIDLDASIDNYTPENPPSGAPTFTNSGDPIPNQSLAQSITFSFDISGLCQDETSYSASGLPSGTGLSFNTSTGIMSGVPNATDVSNSPYTVTFTCTNAFGSINDASQFTVSASPGDTLVVDNVGNTSTLSVNCATFESGGRVDPGDILEIKNGTNGPITISNCHGSAAAPIIIRNKVSASAPAIIRRTTGNAGGYVLQINDSDYFELDGSGKYSGADSGEGGVQEDDLSDNRGDVYGLIVDRTSGANRPSAYVRIGGFSEHFVIRGVKVDGVNKTGNGSGIGFSFNDHAVNQVDYPAGTYRKDVLVEHNYAVNVGKSDGEGFYFGANISDDDVPLRDITFRYNLVDDSARDGINVKDVRAGQNFILNNHIYRPGQSGEDTQHACIAIQYTASFQIAGNRCVDPGGGGFALFFQNDDVGSNATVVIENNFISGVGQTSNAQRSHGIHLTRDGAAETLDLTIRNNTIAGVASTTATGNEVGVNCNSGAVTGTVTNNIIVGVASGVAVNGCGGGSQNTTGTIANQDFDTYSNDGDTENDDYHLTSTSPARNAVTNGNCPATDFDGDTRPQQGICDRGADEYVP